MGIGVEMPKPSTQPSTSGTGPGPVIAADRGRDFAATATRLAAWLEGRIGAPVRLDDLTYPTGAGLSNETILFDATWEQAGAAKRQSFVLRLHPGDFQVYLDPAFERQFRLLQTLGREDLARVPAALWEERDPDVLGRSFFIMERIVGRVPVNHPNYNLAGWLADAKPRDRERAWTSAMEEMARIHRVPADKVRFMLRPEYGSTGFEDEFNYWMRALEWVAGDSRMPLLDTAADWLSRNRPAAPPEGLSWGDARIGNMKFDDNFAVAAVLDWEQASLAGGQQDLGWWLFMDRSAAAFKGVERLEGLGDRQQTIDLWQELTGQSAADVDWYETYAGFKLMIVATRVGHLKQAGPLTGTDTLTGWLSERIR